MKRRGVCALGTLPTQICSTDKAQMGSCTLRDTLVQAHCAGVVVLDLHYSCRSIYLVYVKFISPYLRKSINITVSLKNKACCLLVQHINILI